MSPKGTFDIPIVGQTKTEPKLFALDNAGRPVPVKLGPGLRLDVDIKTADYVLNALAPIPPPMATVCGKEAAFMADTDTFLIAQPVENATPRGISGFALYRNGMRMRLNVDYRVEASVDGLRVFPLDLNDQSKWDGTDYVCADFVATY